jgi:tRNA threonylcarbamoyladenosine biosynthesis protein TsaB
VELVIEAASDEVGVALAVDGVVELSETWETQRNHSVELLPNIDRLLGDAGQTKADISALVVDVGPGGYAGLRVGVSIAKALSHALSVPIVGVGRLEIDASGVAGEQIEDGTRVVAVHRAGRGEVAWAAYRTGAWAEEIAPRITKLAELHGAISDGDVVTGDVDDALADAVQRAGAATASACAHRVVALAALGAARLRAGRLDDAAALVPMYLRAPAIGPT